MLQFIEGIYERTNKAIEKTVEIVAYVAGSTVSYVQLVWFSLEMELRETVEAIGLPRLWTKIFKGKQE